MLLRAPNWVCEHRARSLAADHECGVGSSFGVVEAANDKGQRIDPSKRLVAWMALPKLKMEVGNAHAIAGRSDSTEDVATRYLLALLDVGPAQMAVASPPRCLIDRVLHHNAVSTTPVREDSYDSPVCRSDHRIVHSGGEVDTLMRGRAGSSPDATPIAVVRQNPRGALCRASRKRDDVEESNRDENESPIPWNLRQSLSLLSLLGIVGLPRPAQDDRYCPETTPETGVISGGCRGCGGRT